MSRATKTKIIVMTMLIVIFAALVSVAVVIENKSNVIAIGDDVVFDDGVHNLPKNLVFAVADNASSGTPFTEKTVNLTVNVIPDYATNKNINFILSWVNPESEWANGKNIDSFLTIEKTDATTAKLTCKAPFGEKAIITATSEDNAEKKAKCTIDFLSRMTACRMEFETVDGVGENYGTVTNSSGELYNIRYSGAFDLKFIPIFTIGTTSNAFAIESAQLHLSNQFKEHFKANSTNSDGSALVAIMSINNNKTAFNDSTWIKMGVHATNTDDMKKSAAIYVCNLAYEQKIAMFDLRVKFSTHTEILHFNFGFHVDVAVNNVIINNGSNIVI